MEVQVLLSTSNLVFQICFLNTQKREKNLRQKIVKKVEGKNMTLLSKKDHEMVIEALETLIQSKGENDDKFEYHNLLNWVKLKSKEVF